jgi:hypothetical protein
MTIAAIQAILQNWHYGRALAFYKTTNPDPFLLALFEAGPDPYNERKLRTLLRSLFEDTVHLPAQGSHSAPQAKLDSTDANPYDNHHFPAGKRRLAPLASPLRQDTICPPAKASLSGNLAAPDYPDVKPSVARPLVDYHSAPQEVKWIISERIAAFNRAKLLFENLREDGDPQEEKEKALQILTLRTKVDDHWDQLNYYAEHKILPPKELNPLEGLTESELKDRLRNLRTYITHAKAGRRNADKLSDWETEQKEIERRLQDGHF